MILPAPLSVYPLVEPIFEGRKQYVAARAVLRQNFPGLVWVDDLQHPQTALVWALTRWAYVAGDHHHSRDFLAGLKPFVRDVVTPLARAMGQKWFELYAHPSDEWEAAVEFALEGLSAEKHYENTYVLDRGVFESASSPPVVPAEMTLRHTEFPVVSTSAQRLPFVQQDPARRRAFGYELVQGERVVSVCRSNGLACGTEFMLDVDTPARGERNNGYATVVSRALIADALEEGLEPLWETTEDNTASRRLAGRLGYRERERYPVYAMELPASACQVSGS